MATVHRRDMRSSDFRLLADLSRAYSINNPDSPTSFGPVYELGLVEMTLPVWYKAGSGWQLSQYRQFAQQAIGIETAVFRRMCRYIQYKESIVVQTLFKFSMLAVIDGQKLYEGPRFRMPFLVESDVPWLGDTRFGFVVERRRLEGKFKQE